MAKNTWADGQQFHASDANAIATELNTEESTAVHARLMSIASNGIGAGITLGTVSTAGTSEVLFPVAIAASGLTAEWAHSYTNSQGSNGDQDPTGSITFSASMRVNGTIHRLTFNGRTTVTLDPGGRVLADELAIPVTVGTVVGVRTYLSSGTAYAPRGTAGVADDGGFVATTDLTAPGSATITPSFGYVYAPIALLGYPPLDGTAKSVLILGDDLARGNGDGGTGDISGAVNEVAVGSGGGFVVRALKGVAGVLNLASLADQAQFWAEQGGGKRRGQYAQRCNAAVITLGVWDLDSRTAAQLEGDLVTIAFALQRRGIRTTYITTITPYVATSTDNWATTGGQTVNSANAARVTHNTWVRAGSPIDPTALTPVAAGTSGALLAGQPGHPITGFFEVANTVESAQNSGVWKGANRVVHDGAITSGTTTLTSASANFNSASLPAGDLNSYVFVAGAGASGATLGGWISNVISATQVTLTTAASTTVSGATAVIGPTTVDGLNPSPNGHYLASQAINPALL